MTEVCLDHAATTKLSKEALGAMLPYSLNEYGNPSSQYSIGERARKAVTKAREQIAAALWCSPEEIYLLLVEQKQITGPLNLLFQMNGPDRFWYHRLNIRR